MPDLTVKRTLVKSPPELWSEVSEVESLARHLDQLGEIKISRLEPERTVAWEGKHARGTVEIEESGWGTQVTLTAEVETAPVPSPQSPGVRAPAAAVEPPAPVAEPEPVVTEPEPGPVAEEAPPVMAQSRAGMFSRWFFRQRRAELEAEPEHVVPPEPVAAPAPEPEPEPIPVVPEPEPEPEPVAEEAPPGLDAERVLAVLEETLDSLGSAHHRPFSRG